MASRAFSAPCQTWRQSTSSYELCTSCYKLLRYNAILKPSSDELLREAYELLRYDTILEPSSDEFTTIFLRVSAITVRLSTSSLQISTSWENIIGLAYLNCPHTIANRLANVRRIWNSKESHCNATASKAFSVADLRCTIASFSRMRQYFKTSFQKKKSPHVRSNFDSPYIRHTYAVRSKVTQQVSSAFAA